MYVEKLPTYGYEMPCGWKFRTHVKSVSLQGCHWFPCRRCTLTHCIREAELRFMAPLRLSSMDEAIIKDRILKDLRAAWCDVTASELAERYGVSVRLVEYVSTGIGRRC